MPETRADIFGAWNPRTEASAVGEGEADSAVITSSSIYLVGGNANVIADVDSIAIGTTAQWDNPDGCTITGNYAAGPGASGTHATRIQNAAANWGSLRLFGYYDQQSSTVYTLSFYARETTTGSTSGAGLLTRLNGSGFNWPALNTTWQRLSFQVTSGSDAFLGIDKFLDISAAVAFDLLLWGAKLELGTSATGSYP